jgi:hypothetical protein
MHLAKSDVFIQEQLVAVCGGLRAVGDNGVSALQARVDVDGSEAVGKTTRAEDALKSGADLTI